ncbi:MAG: hypothetical protein HY057_04370 [Rhodospirillales bacterium]|nr:hypothetical protein [Rhodospirillales bacterium]
MAYDASLAVRAGALLLTLMGTILVIKSIRAPVRNFRHTELWILLDRQHGLPENQAQQMIGGVLRDRYMWHAQITAVAALVLWLLAFLLAAIRLPGAE